MFYTIPDYYHDFHCIADTCEDTCCAGWQIVADKKSLKKYSKVRGPFRKQLRSGIDWKNRCFCQDEEKRCAFLNENNLCEMYKNIGEGSLCRTCRLYPRHIEEFEDSREITLSVSCPEVARILMNHMDPVTFRTVEREGEEEYDDFDPFLYSQLLDSRDVIYKILQNRTLPVDVRMGLSYGIARDVQKRINDEILFSIGDVLKKYQGEKALHFVRQKLAQNCGSEQHFDFMKKMFHRLFELELLKEDWGLLLLETEKRIFTDSDPNSYAELSAEFASWMTCDPHNLHWEIRKEQLCMYFVSTYFCGAVYDAQVLSKMQFALMSVDFIEEILKARWLRNERDLNDEELIELVYRFSREIEHSDHNLRKIEKMMPVVHGRFC